MKDFFKKILPEGFVVVAHPNGKGGFSQRVCQDVKSAEQCISQLDPTTKDLYFGLGSLKEKSIMRDGKVVVRVKENIHHLKSFFLDMDIGDDPKKYPDQAAAIAAITSFADLHELPQPMLVSSGRGLHVYWPLKKGVPAQLWSETAKVFKQCLIAKGIKADPMVTADTTSLLRIPGTINHKNGSMVEILRDAEPINGAAFAKAILKIAKEMDITMPPPLIGGEAPRSDLGDLGNNTEQPCDFPPADFSRIRTECNQVKRMIATGCDSEPIWYAAMGLVKMVTDPEEAALEVSRNHPDFNEMDTRRKLAQAVASNTGPTTCERLRTLNPKSCEGCKHKVTSPIMLGVTPVAKPLPEDIPLALPYPYVVGPKGCGVAMEGQEKVEIFPMDIYPKRRVNSELSKSAATVWAVRMPDIKQFVEVEIQQSLLADPRLLHRFLCEKSIFITHPQVLKTANFMIAYVKKLQEQTELEQSYASFGWRDDNSFVLSDTIYLPDGKIRKHHAGDHIHDAVQGLETYGSLDGWVDTMQFYNAPDHAPHRFSLYTAFASIIYHMTGHAGALCFLTGPSGHGKTTVLRAINSIFGHPTRMGINGTMTGTTENALYSMLGAYKNLPICLDDMSHWEPKAFARFALAISQGVGKRRSSRSGMVSKILDKWSLIAFASGNSDAYTTLAGARNDSIAEAMRIFQIHMELPKTYTIEAANHFANTALFNHYGLAGQEFVPWVVKNYDKIRKVLANNVDMIAKRSHAISSERYWSSMIASAATAGSIARRINLLPDFPVEKDIEWAIGTMQNARSQVYDNTSTPTEVLAEYLNSRLNETLIVITSKGGTVRVDSEPRNDLLVRRDLGLKIAMINRKDFRSYCDKRGCISRQVITALITSKVITENGVLRTLGSKTQFASGQVRVIEVDLTRLEAFTESSVK